MKYGLSMLDSGYFKGGLRKTRLAALKIFSICSSSFSIIYSNRKVAQSMSRSNHLFPKDLPAPTIFEEEHCQKVFGKLIQEISLNEHGLSFERFMQFCLYEPGLGYYNVGTQKFGPLGDFVTAPEISPLFSKCVAKKCQKFLDEKIAQSIFEFGAGSGVMCAEILLYLQSQGSLPEKYFILEISAELKYRQRETILQKCPDLLNKVEWLSELPRSAMQLIILANEVLDAMPVARFYWDKHKLQEYYVTEQHHQLQYTLKEPRKFLSKVFFDEVVPWIEKLSDYTSEINLLLPGWLKSISEFLASGVLILIDYGYTDASYYHPDRNMGTLIAHYKHRTNHDLLSLVGLQDITAHVNFSQVEHYAGQNGMCLETYQTQAEFLISQGIETMVNTEDEITYYREAQQLKYLMLPSEMGEIFKVMILRKM